MKKVLLFLNDGHMVNMADACIDDPNKIVLKTVVFDNSQIIPVNEYDLVVIANYLDPKKMDDKYFFGHDALLAIISQGYKNKIMIALTELKHDVKMYLRLDNDDDVSILEEHINVNFFKEKKLTANTYFIKEYLLFPGIMFFPF